MPMGKQTARQEEQYRFPYHYLPTYDGTRFSQLQHWSWGYRYLGRLEVTLDLLGTLAFRSLVDVGCGDGRFLAEVRKRWPDRTVLGIDSSETAVTLARSMNPEIAVETRDILRSPLDQQFDVATLLDVIEHVAPESLPAFLQAVSHSLRPGGYLVLTAPHRNETHVAKHYQHFDSTGLRQMLSGAFPEPRFVFFDRRSWRSRLAWKLLGGSGRFYIITHSGLNTLMFNYYRRRCLYAPDERSCLRLACVAQKASTSGAGSEHGQLDT